jgi:uncharacterized protein YjiS (DUF1127 family)
MEAFVARHAAAGWVWKLAQVMHAVAASLRNLALHLDAWLLARHQAAADDQALEAMSERELRDIGIDPARVHGSAQRAWARDWAV